MSSIAKNTSYFTFALILQKVVSFTYFAILARNLDPEKLGAYYTAISLATIFAIFIDLGLTNVLTREVAKDQANANKLLGVITAIKIPLALVSVVILFATVNVLGYSQLTKNLVYLLVFSMALDPFIATYFAVSRGYQNLKFESFSVVGYQLIVLVIGLTSIYAKKPLEFLAVALSIATILNFIYSLWLIKYKFKTKVKPDFNREAMASVLGIAVPFALFAILQRLYMYLDSVFLSILAGEKYVGLYQIAFKIVFALQFLPMAFIASLYPAFSRYYKEKDNQIVVSFERAVNYLLIISVPISVGIIVLADKILTIFKPEYIEAKSSLQIIMLSLPFLFINFPIGALLNACDKQKVNTRNMAVSLVIAVGMNLLLIPYYKTLGASITVLVTNILMFKMGIWEVRKIIDYKAKNNILVFIKSLLAAGIMYLILIYFKTTLNIFLIIPTAAIAYALALFTVGGVKLDDIKSVAKSFRK